MVDEVGESERVRRRRISWFLRVALALAILALVVREAPLSGVAERTREARLEPLLLALALAGVSSLLQAVRLWLLARALGLSPTIANAAGVNLSALFYGLFLPGGNVTGGAIRFYRLAGSTRQLTAAAGAIAWDRLSATVSLCLVGLGCWLLAPSPKPSWAAIAFGLGTGTILGLMALSLLATRMAVSAAPSSTPATTRVQRVVKGLRTALREAARLKVSDHLASLALSVGSQILGTGVYLALASAIGVRVPAFDIGWIRAAVMLILLLPITISGLGVREGALMVLLAGEGVGQAPAVALGVLVFGATVLAPALVGGFSEGIRYILGSNMR